MYEIYEKLRDQRHLLNYHVAKTAKISPATFTHWKNGEYKPKYETIKKIADALGVPVSVFYEGGGDG